MSQLVDLSVDGRVAEVTLARPGHHNQITAEMMRQFIDRLSSADDADADVLVLRGEGPHFCVGRDQDEDPPDLTKRQNLSLIFDANEALTSFDGISIAAVSGKAAGFGCGIATQCDVTIATDTASFGFDEIHHGFAPTIVMTWLETYVPRKVALDLLVTGRLVPAIEARELGLVTRVVREDAFDETVAAVVDDLLGKNPDALATCKFYLREIGEVPADDRREYALDTILGIE